MELATTPLVCDRYHHFYHYQASAYYLWLAETLNFLGEYFAADEAFTKAIFQDHRNKEAKDRKGVRSEVFRPIFYNEHPLSDAVFCESVGRLTGVATALHDTALKHYLAQDFETALNALVTCEQENGFFLKGKCWIAMGEYEQAKIALQEAVRLSHIQHDNYHQQAAAAHIERGTLFLKQNALDLAIADFSKALDLHKNNPLALELRAKTYNLKGKAIDIFINN